MKRPIYWPLAVLGLTALVLATGPGAALARQPHATPAKGLVFVSPANGAVYQSSAPYRFQVRPLTGATGYLWSFVQGGVIVFQNLAWDGRLSAATYTVAPGSPAHRLIHVGALQVWVRALLRTGQWSGMGTVRVRIAGASQPSAPAAPAQPIAPPIVPAPGAGLFGVGTDGQRV